MKSSKVKSKSKRNAKIVATIGPASNSREEIRNLIQAGLNVARLNFSHGNHQEHKQTLELIREEAKALNAHVAVMQDLCGPKIRITEVDSGEIELEDGGKIQLAYSKDSKDKGDLNTLYISVFEPSKVIKKGEKVLLADGRITLLAEKVNEKHVSCSIVSGGALRSKAGISLPESELDLPSLTSKDKEDIKWSMNNDIDYVALSFVGSLEDLTLTREEMSKHGKPLPLIAKIERAKALDNLTSIVKNSDGVMVARGDLGVDLPLQKVPAAQRLVISTANFEGVPVITATQMLMSMVEEVRPTRAEVSDVVTAVRDGTDAVMLSEETAMGKHPALAVKVLSDIVIEAEHEISFESNTYNRNSDKASVSDATCFAACSAAEKINASAILACTESGQTAKLMAKYRPEQPLYGATSQKKSLNRMVLYWGVEPILINVDKNAGIEAEIAAAMNAIRDEYDVKPESRVVVTAGLRTKSTGSTNVTQIREIPRKNES